MFNKKYGLVRRPPQSMAKGITTQTETIDFALAQQQHQQYLQALRELGISVTVLDAEEDLPDSHFVEDTAIVHKQTAILTRPGAAERQNEVGRIKPHLEKMLAVHAVDDDALIDGGDVLFAGNHVLIGLSYRTNHAGANYLKTKLLTLDPELKVHFIEFEGVLHLKTGLTALTQDLLLGNPMMKVLTPLPIENVIWLPEVEAYAANTLVVNGAAIYFQECASARSAIEQAGLKPMPMDLSEFRKMDGSFTCLSLLW